MFLVDLSITDDTKTLIQFSNWLNCCTQDVEDIPELLMKTQFKLLERYSNLYSFSPQAPVNMNNNNCSLWRVVITIRSCQSLATMKMRSVWKIFSSITEFLIKICQTSQCWVTQNHKEAELILWANVLRTVKSKQKNKESGFFSQVEEFQANKAQDSDIYHYLITSDFKTSW